MSLDDETPTQYFGPHARRWTHPVTGKTLSVSPNDYRRLQEGYYDQKREELRAHLNGDGPFPDGVIDTAGIAEEIDAEGSWEPLERGDFDQDAAKRGIMNLLDDLYDLYDEQATGAIHVDPPPTTLTVDNARISDIRLDENGIGSIQIDKREWTTGTPAEVNTLPENIQPRHPSGIITLDTLYLNGPEFDAYREMFKDDGVVLPGTGKTIRKTDSQLCIEDANEYAADYVAQLERRARTAKRWNWVFAIAGVLALAAGLAGVR